MDKSQLLKLITDQVGDKDNIKAQLVRQTIKTEKDGFTQKDPGEKFICIIIGPDTPESNEVLNFFERSCGGEVVAGS